MVKNRHICGSCGFEARSASGLAGHKQLAHSKIEGSQSSKYGAIEERLDSIEECLKAVYERLEHEEPLKEEETKKAPRKPSERVLATKKEEWIGALPFDSYECPKCRYRQENNYTYCPSCGSGPFEWLTDKERKKREEKTKEPTGEPKKKETKMWWQE